MIVAVVVAVAVVAGAPWPLVAIGGAFGIAPGLATVGLAGFATVVAIRRRLGSSTAASEADLFRALEASVSAGATLRGAIAQADHPAVTKVVTRLCSVGAPMAHIGAELADLLPVNGRSFSSLCAMSELTGSSVSRALDGFAERAERAEENRRRRRVSLTQTRMSAWVVGAAPLALTAVVLGVRGVPEPGGVVVVVPIMVGAAMQVAGMVIVFAASGKAMT